MNVQRYIQSEDNMRQTMSLQEYLKQYSKETGIKPKVVDYSGLDECRKNVTKCNIAYKLKYAVTK